jgi:nitrite reductase/ring-hydroxylating ferredoxin subunit
MDSRNVSPETTCNRRAFLQQVERRVIVTASMPRIVRCMLPMFIAACGGARYAMSRVDGNRIVVDRVEFDATGAALVDVPGGELPIHVRRIDDGTFDALSTRCMHRGCQVDRGIDRFICPCHGSQYSLEGEVLKGPTEKPLARFQTSADERNVYVHLDVQLPSGKRS